MTVDQYRKRMAELRGKHREITKIKKETAEKEKAKVRLQEQDLLSAKAEVHKCLKELKIGERQFNSVLEATTEID